MRIRMCMTLIMSLLVLIVPEWAHAQLSDLSKSRIQRAAVQCEEMNNELIYKEYWKDSVKPENLETVCLAEKYSDQVAADGDFWLQVNTETLMQDCKEQTQKDRNMYFLCLKQNLLEKAHNVSEPCVELGKEKLWDEEKCRQLVSYIFIKNFEDRMPKIERDASKANMTELSMISSWRIRQAKVHCEQYNNEILYKEYWGKALDTGDLKTICMAEQFADQVAGDGYQWLNNKAVGVIESCKLQGKKDKGIYAFCLQKNLQNVAKMLSAPCAEMGEQKLWDEHMCRRLVSYIFVQDFEEVLAENTSFFENLKNSFDKFSRVTLLRIMFNPIIAIIILFIFVLDVVYLVTPGNWTQVSRLSVFVGPLVLIAYFLQGGLRLMLSGFIIVSLLILIFWNHIKSVFKSEKKDSNIKIIE